MITNVRFCLSYELLNEILSLQSLFIWMKIFIWTKIYIVVTDIAMTLLVPAKSVM